MQTKRILKEVAIWVLTLLLVLMFGNAGIRKFFENGGWTVFFRRFGFPDWFRYAVGIWETAAAALLIVPRTAAYGALAVIIIMFGAIGTSATKLTGHNMWVGMIPPLVAILLATIVLFVRRRQAAAITPARPLAPQQ